MKVKIKTGFWEMQEYELSIGENEIFLFSGGAQWRIPFPDLVSFSLAGPSDAPDRFTMETKDGSYDGRFANAKDAKEAVNQLSKHRGLKIEINLTSGRII